MCRVGGPRCDYHAEASAQRYQNKVAFQKQLADDLTARGIVTACVKTVSASALPKLAEAAGINPQDLFTRAAARDDTHVLSLDSVPGMTKPSPLSDKDAAAVIAVYDAYKPSPELVRRLVMSSNIAHEELSGSWHAMKQSDARVKELRDAVTAARNSGDDESAVQAHLALKEECLNSVLKENAFALRMDMYLNSVNAAVRGDEFVPREDVDAARRGELTEFTNALPEGVSVLPEGTIPDPAYITPLRALGLSDRRTPTGARKSLSDRGRDMSLSAAGRRTQLPKHDERADELILGVVDDGSGSVQRIGALVGTADINAFIEAIQYDDDGAIRAAIVNAGPVDGVSVGDDVRARALYSAHVLGAPEAVVTALVGGQPKEFRYAVASATVEDVAEGTSFIHAVSEVPSNREAMRKGAAEPRAHRCRMKDSEREDVSAAESNLAALLPHMGRAAVKRELAERKGRGQDLDTAVRGMLAENFSREKMGTLSGVDGETAGIFPGRDKRGFDPEYADWIETGIVRHDATGTEVSRFEKLHGVHPTILSVNGTGAQDIHNISPEMVAGKTRFDEDHDDVRDELLAGDVLVAHNVVFEKKHLTAVIPELSTARPWLDTQWLAKHFMPAELSKDGRTGLRLQHFVEDLGGTYEDAHRAGADTAMMMSSLEKFFAQPNWWEAR